MQLKTGTLLQGGKYRIEKVIGRSSINIIYLATKQNRNDKFVIKEFFLKDINDKSLIDLYKKKFVREGLLLQKLNHKDIVKCTDVFEENNTSYYVTKFVDGVSLRDYIDESVRFDSFELHINESRSVFFIKLIANALDYLHKHGICHLDIKPSNIIFNYAYPWGLNPRGITLLDFGSAASFNESLSREFLEFYTDRQSMGTLGYAPLELGSPYSKISPATDIYSLGATWYFLLTGKRPPSAVEVLENGGINEIQGASAKVNNAIRAAMNPQMKLRPQSISEFLALFDEKLDDPSEETSVPDFEVEAETVNEPQQALAVGTELIGPSYTYVIKKVLGQGGFGITYLASVKLKGLLGTLDSEMKVAVKEFYMRDYCMRDNSGSVSFTDSSKGSISKKYAKKFVKEALHLSKLHHPNIVKVAESFEYNNTSYYVMEYLDGQCLDDYVAENLGLSEYESIKFIRQIGAALSYMHSQEMLHMDVKPKNVMLKDGRCVLIDFGLTKQYDEQGQPESSTGLGAGTAGYAPLEQMNYSGDKEFAPTIDVYALGATLYKMLTSKTPPPASVILNDGFDRSELETINVSSDTIDVITMAMEPMKKKRIQTIDEFLMLLPSEETVRSSQKTNRSQESEDTIVKDSLCKEYFCNLEEINGIPVRWHVKSSEYQKKTIRGLLNRMTLLNDGMYVLTDYISHEEIKAFIPNITDYQSSPSSASVSDILQFIQEINDITQTISGFTLMDKKHLYEQEMMSNFISDSVLVADIASPIRNIIENKGTSLSTVLDLRAYLNEDNELSFNKLTDIASHSGRFRFKIMIDSHLFYFMYKRPDET